MECNSQEGNEGHVWLGWAGLVLVLVARLMFCYELGYPAQLSSQSIMSNYSEPRPVLGYLYPNQTLSPSSTRQQRAIQTIPAAQLHLPYISTSQCDPFCSRGPWYGCLFHSVWLLGSTHSRGEDDVLLIISNAQIMASFKRGKYGLKGRRWKIMANVPMTWQI